MIDHPIPTMAEEAACEHRYTEVLGMQLETIVGGTPPVARRAFEFVQQKLKLHVKGREFEPKEAQQKVLISSEHLVHLRGIRP
jgi:hypothetical protein